jgi:hypothetical protein
MGRQQLASEAGRIIELGTHEQRAQAALAAMEKYNIDPDESQIDDYLNDPEMLVFALSNILDGGSFQDAVKGNQAVNKFRREQMAEQEFAPAQFLNLGGRTVAAGGRGQELGSFARSVDPDTVYRERAQTRRSSATNATTLEAARIRKAKDEEGEQGQPGEVGPWTQYQQPPAQGQPR